MARLPTQNALSVSFGVGSFETLSYARAVARRTGREIVPLRVVATHDFCCSYVPSPTSYGSLPGAEWVVALFHDGVDWRFGERGYEAQPESLAERCRPWADEVDVIFASHTLGRWMGRIEGTPVVQPWPFGAELGVVELGRGREPKTYGITPGIGGRWKGTGSELLDEASSRVLGEVDRPLSNTSGGPSALADYFARALREATGASAAAFDMLASQAPMDGVLSYLPAGPVTEADVLRLYPWPDATVVGELGEEEVRAVARSAWP
jgi:2',3'-cyclic-nucleotide 2'-phosphodiesterase (5'-nucleotidase family)